MFLILVLFYYHLMTMFRLVFRPTVGMKDYAKKLVYFLDNNELDAPWVGALVLFVTMATPAGSVASAGTPVLVTYQHGRIYYAYSYSNKVSKPTTDVAELAAMFRETYQHPISFGWALRDPKMNLLQWAWK